MQTQENEPKAPQLFGLDGRTNRNFGEMTSWGKNQFNSSFPAALMCFMHSLGLHANYVSRMSEGTQVCEVPFTDLLKIDLSSPECFFAFEVPFDAFASRVSGSLPRTDLVLARRLQTSTKQLTPLEVKFTVVPDSVTASSGADSQGPELVVRPDTILYTALLLDADNHGALKAWAESSSLRDTAWSDRDAARSALPQTLRELEDLRSDTSLSESPTILQPIWKTIGTSAMLADQCLDIFFWSSMALLSLLVANAANARGGNTINRSQRSVIWIHQCLVALGLERPVDFGRVVSDCSYSVRNDKAFASSGSVIGPYLRSKSLEVPRIKAAQLDQLILNGGAEYLSPERRFDASVKLCLGK